MEILEMLYKKFPSLSFFMEDFKLVCLDMMLIEENSETALAFQGYAFPFWKWKKQLSGKKKDNAAKPFNSIIDISNNSN